MSDYRVTVKVQNNNILRMVESLGYQSLLSFSNSTGYGYSTLCKLINMKDAPLGRDGKMREAVYQLADVLGCLPEQLFSATQMETALESNKRTFEVEEAEMRFMLDSSSSNRKSLEDSVMETERDVAITNALDTLTTREKEIIELRFGVGGSCESHSLDDVAKKFGVTRTRISQIEVKAIRKLRLSSRTVLLKEFA